MVLFVIPGNIYSTMQRLDTSFTLFVNNLRVLTFVIYLPLMVKVTLLDIFYKTVCCIYSFVLGKCIQFGRCEYVSKLILIILFLSIEVQHEISEKLGGERMGRLKAERIISV